MNCDLKTMAGFKKKIQAMAGEQCYSEQLLRGLVVVSNRKGACITL